MRERCYDQETEFSCTKLDVSGRINYKAITRSPQRGEENYNCSKRYCTAGE
jgi:hypothetical protein